MPTDIEMESVSLMELLSLAEDIHVKTREASQNTDLDIQKYLRSNNACSPYRVSWKITTQNKQRLIKTSKRTIQN